MVTMLGLPLIAIGVGPVPILWGAEPSFQGLTDSQKQRVQRIGDRAKSIRKRLDESKPKIEMESMDGMQAKIVNGVPAGPGDFPWAASIAMVTQNGSLFSYCGGSLLAPEWVATAAHCEVEVGDKVILGRHDLTTNQGHVHNVIQVINHEDYNAQPNDSDIALLKLDPASSETPISLIPDGSNLATTGNDFTVVGWGHTEEGGTASDVLMEVTVPIFSNQSCQDAYSGVVNITDNMLCAAAEGKDSCQGDSGGPGMVVDSAQDMDRLAGVVSFGVGCARPDFPGVYTRVSQFVDWVNEKADIGTQSPPPPPPPSNQIPINPPLTQGSISPAGTENLFSFTVETQGSYTIQTKGETGTVDTVMSLFGPDSQATLIEENDDLKPGNFNSRIERSLAPGTYYVKVKLYHDNQVGNYTIFVQAHE